MTEIALGVPTNPSTAEIASMPDLTSLDNLYLIVGFLAPGLIVLFVRSQFVTGRIAPNLGVVPYVIVSVVYYALASPFVEIVLSIREPGLGKVLAWFGLIFAGPAALGLLLGVNIQKDLFRRVLQRCGLNLVHAIPTAWEWKFGAMPPQGVLVTLKDGTRFAGYCGPKSFISSDPAERDMYIERVYDLDDQNNWVDVGKKEVLITAGEIQTIEFWPCT